MICVSPVHVTVKNTSCKSTSKSSWCGVHCLRVSALGCLVLSISPVSARYVIDGVCEGRVLFTSWWFEAWGGEEGRREQGSPMSLLEATQWANFWHLFLYLTSTRSWLQKTLTWWTLGSFNASFFNYSFSASDSVCLYLSFSFLLVLGIEPRVSHMLNKCSTTKLHP